MSDNPLDKLVTRDPAAMEHTLEDAEYAGTDAVIELDSGLLEVRAGNAAGLSTLPRDPAADSNLNPGYTPPSQTIVPHPASGAADLPEGAPAATELEQGGQGR